jgi:CsoR family transcriptional regulator, copper-sensing transcriptional repressor
MDQAPEEAKDLQDTALGRGSEEKLEEVQERWENRLAWPVFVAAIVSVPAVFLTLLDEPYEMVGHIGLWLVTVVLVFETVVLFLVSPKKIDWLRRNWWLIGMTVAAVLAVVFSIGPLQLFRLLRSVGALRVVRAKQVARAGESLGKKGQSRWRRGLGKFLATLVVGSFVVIAMVDPDSEARSSLEGLVGEEGAIAAAVGAGLVTMIGMYFLVRSPRDQGDEEDRHEGAASQRR